MESSLPSSLLGGLFLLCAAAIAGVFALLLRRIRAEDRSAEKGTSEENRAAVPGNHGPGRAWPSVVGIILGALAVAGVLLAFDRLSHPDQLVIKVTAYQFGWRFDYYEAGSGKADLESVRDPRGAGTLKIRSLGVSTKDRLTLPQQADVLFLVTSIDVVHRFRVPEFQVRRDVLPGAVTAVRVRPQRTGRFVVSSDDICGAGDRLMVAALDIVGSGDFHAWLAQKQSAEDAAAGAD